MPKPFSRRFDAYLAAYKGSKPKKAKVTAITSPYDGVNESEFSGPFGSGRSGFETYKNEQGQDAKRIATDMTLAPQLQTAADTAMTGLNNNLGFLQRDPNERVNFLTSGQDPMYNVLTEQANRALDANLGRARLDAQTGGRANSTTAGAALGAILNDDTLRRNQILLSGLNYGNENARADANLNMGAIGNMAQLVYPLGSAANAQLNTSLQDQGRAQALTAQAKNAAEQQYVNSLNSYNQQQGSGLASGIGTLAGAGLGALLAIPTGGLSLAAGASLGGALGGAAGGMFGGGGGGGSMPYIPQSFNSGYGGGGYNLGAAGGGIPGYNFGSSLNLPNWNNFNTSLAVA